MKKLFSTLLLFSTLWSANALDWEGAQWIWQQENGPANSWVCFRKTVQLSEVPADALARIAVDSRFWFSVNGRLNSFLVWENSEIKNPLEKTVYGSTYGIIRSVFENSTLLGSEMNVPNLAEGVKAVSARVVIKDGQTTILVVNLTNREVPLIINIDGKRYFKDFEHKTYAFSTMTEQPDLPFHAYPLTLVKKGSGDVSLPKFSINTIVFKDSKQP